MSYRALSPETFGAIMIRIDTISTLLCLFFLSCQQKMDSSRVVLQNGLYVDNQTNKVLDGKYLITTKTDFTVGAKEQKSEESYANGIPVKDWIYVYGEDTIHIGRYLEENSIRSELTSIANAQRVDLNFWREGQYSFLSIQIIDPKSLDSTSTERICNLALANLKEKYPFKTVVIDKITDLEKIELKKFDLE